MARDFDGSTQYLSGSISPLSMPFTMAGWINADSLATQMFVERYGFGNRWFQLKTLVSGSNTFVRATHQNGISVQSATTTTTLSSGTWHHVCGTFGAGNNRTVYLDGGGKNVNTNSVAGMATASASFAYGVSSTVGHFDGRMAEWGFWDKALSDAEVATLALGYSPLLVGRGNLSRYFRFLADEDASLVVAKSTLSITGSPGTAPHPRIIIPLPRYRRSTPQPAGSAVDSIIYRGMVA